MPSLLRELEKQEQEQTSTVAETKQKAQVQKLVALRHALHRHMEQLRASIMDYPLVVERRIADSDTPPPRIVQALNEQEPPAPESGSHKLAR